MKKLLCAVLFAFACCLCASATTVVVTGTNVYYPVGFPLASGEWCFGATCAPIINGAFTDSVASGTATVTITVGSQTILTIPSVVLSGTAYNWNTFVVPTTATISGTGYPTIACAVGATYSQTDSVPQYSSWTCKSVAGTATWINSPALNVFKSGAYTGTGAPSFSCYSPCSYTQSDASPTSSAIWVVIAAQGTPSNNWVQQSGTSSTTNWAVPGTIGSTTPNTGAFTTLSTNGVVVKPTYSGTVTATTALTATGTITGITASSNCSFSASNAVGGVDMTANSPFITPSTNTVTIAFVGTIATTGGTFNVHCQ